MKINFKNKKFIISAAADGIGFSIAKKLLILEAMFLLRI